MEPIQNNSVIKIEPLIFHYLYNNVILYFERELKPKPTGLRITNPHIKLYLIANHINPVIVDNKCKIKTPEQFERSSDSLIICRKYSKYSSLVSVIAHFRNSLAHGRFLLYTMNGEIFIALTDKPKKKEISMVAQMPFRVFWGLIEMIKQNKR